MHVLCINYEAMRHLGDHGDQTETETPPSIRWCSVMEISTDIIVHPGSIFGRHIPAKFDSNDSEN